MNYLVAFILCFISPVICLGQISELPSKEAINRINTINKVVLQVEILPSASAVSIDKNKLLIFAQSLLTQRGMEIVEAGTIDPGTTHDICIEIQSIHTRDNIYLYNVMVRCSLYSDRKLTKNEQGKAQRIWFNRQIAGQKGEAGYQTNLAKAIRDTVTELLGGPKTLPTPGVPQKASQDTGIKPIVDGIPNTKIVDFSFLQMKVKKMPAAPPYPEGAKANGIQGTVALEMMVDPVGMPSRVVAKSGPPELLITAIRYALNWEFEPSYRNGIAVEARFMLTMPFKLR